MYKRQIITNSVESRPLTVGLQVFSSTDQGIDWSVITAATLMSAAPLLIAFLLFQRQFVQSVSYTHLDVYKRQSYGEAAPHNKKPAFIRRAFFFCAADRLSLAATCRRRRYRVRARPAAARGSRRR